MIHDKRAPLVGLAGAMLLSAALVVWLGRGTIFSPDETTWFMTSPQLSFGDALHPYGGHLVLTSRLLYPALLENLGTDYLTFRLMSVAAVLLTSALFFAYASRRIGRPLALAPTSILLFLGSDNLHLLQGNGFTVLLSISCGLAALLLLERGGRAGDLAACALLCIGVVTYSVALAFVVGVTIAVLMIPGHWRRLWIPAVPALIYTAWWLWSRGSTPAPQGGIVLWNLLVIPSWSFSSLSSSLGALTGLSYNFGGSAPKASEVGDALALLFVGAVAWRAWSRSPPPTLWPVVGIALSLWTLESIAADNLNNNPDSAHYLYSNAVVVLLVATEAVNGVRWSRRAVAGLCLIIAIGLATNLAYLRNGAEYLRNQYTPAMRSGLGALDLAGSRADPDFAFSLPGPVDEAGLAFPFTSVASLGHPPTEAYLRAARRYGPLGYAPPELEQQDSVDRNYADSVLAAALGLRLIPVEATRARACSRVRVAAGQQISLPLFRGGAVLEATGSGGAVEVGRFGDAFVSVGTLTPGVPMALRLPVDESRRPWRLSTSANPLRVCRPAVL